MIKIKIFTEYSASCVEEAANEFLKTLLKRHNPFVLFSMSSNQDGEMLYGIMIQYEEKE